MNTVADRTKKEKHKRVARYRCNTATYLEALEKHTIVTTKEAAKILGISPATLSIWTCKNRYPDLKSIKIGRLRRFWVKDIIAFLKSRRSLNTRGIGTISERNNIVC